ARRAVAVDGHAGGVVRAFDGRGVGGPILGEVGDRRAVHIEVVERIIVRARAGLVAGDVLDGGPVDCVVADLDLIIDGVGGFPVEPDLGDVKRGAQVDVDPAGTAVLHPLAARPASRAVAVDGHAGRVVRAFDGRGVGGPILGEVG